MISKVHGSVNTWTHSMSYLLNGSDIKIRRTVYETERPMGKHGGHAGNGTSPGNVIWRFYRTYEQYWRWERLSTDRTVIARSIKGYSDYEACIENAEKNGYRLWAAGPSLRPLPGPRFKVPHTYLFKTNRKAREVH